MGKTIRKNSDFPKKNHRNKDSHREYNHNSMDLVWEEIETPEERVKRLQQIDKDMWNMYGNHRNP